MGHNSIQNCALETNNQLTNYVRRLTRQNFYSKKAKEKQKDQNTRLTNNRWKGPRVNEKHSESSSVPTFVWICDLFWLILFSSSTSRDANDFILWPNSVAFPQCAQNLYYYYRSLFKCNIILIVRKCYQWLATSNITWDSISFVSFFINGQSKWKRLLILI